MTQCLYISLTGMTEPLGESQVVQYLLELAKKNTVYLLSFEKPKDSANIPAMEEKLQKAGIQWQYLTYSNRFGVLSSLLQITSAFISLFKLVHQKKITLIHARSLIAALIGVLLKNTSKAKLIFDIRGFAIDEKIVEGRLGSKTQLTRVLKQIEAMVYKQADHIVTLTHASKPIISEKYGIKAETITVIPTCANLELFKPADLPQKKAAKKSLGFTEEDKIILHNGSINSWVDFDAEIKLFKALNELNPTVKLLCLNKDQHDIILTYLKKYAISPHQYQLHAAPFTEVGNYLKAADICLFFIKPSFAKMASAPTKFAELVACHLYTVTNTQYGDMEHYLKHYPVGYLFNLESIHASPKQAASELLAYIETLNSERDQKHFDQLFANNFSKELAIERYQHIYNQLVGA